ncbi:hypothetical protein V1511DRAFT_503864 [Dipodascopsis uninucleata]
MADHEMDDGIEIPVSLIAPITAKTADHSNLETESDSTETSSADTGRSLADESITENDDNDDNAYGSEHSNDDEDGFGGSYEEDSDQLSNRTLSADILRLKREHSQQGYIDGITAAKPSSVQPAFDEGYPMGSAFGIVVGKILGLFQGLKSYPSENISLDKLVDLERRARADLLNIQDIFGESFWKVDESTGDIQPSWTVPADEYEGSSDRSVLKSLPQEYIMAYHPVVKRWSNVVESLLQDISKQKATTPAPPF